MKWWLMSKRQNWSSLSNCTPEKWYQCNKTKRMSLINRLILGKLKMLESVIYFQAYFSFIRRCFYFQRFSWHQRLKSIISFPVLMKFVEYFTNMWETLFINPERIIKQFHSWFGWKLEIQALSTGYKKNESFFSFFHF